MARIRSGWITDSARRRQPRVQIVGRELVHQEADGAAMHAVDRLARMHVPVQRLQHQSVAAERYHDVGVGRIVIAVELRPAAPAPAGPPRRRSRRRRSGHIAGGWSWDPSGSVSAAGGTLVAARKLVYTTLAVLVEIRSPKAGAKSLPPTRELYPATRFEIIANRPRASEEKDLTTITRRSGPRWFACAAFCNACARRPWRAVVMRRPQPSSPPVDGCAACGRPSGQKGGSSVRARGNAAASPAPPRHIGCRRIPPPNKPSRLPGRTLAFTATAGSIRLFNERASRKPISPTRPISWMAPIRAAVP